MAITFIGKEEQKIKLGEYETSSMMATIEVFEVDTKDNTVKVGVGPEGTLKTAQWFSKQDLLDFKELLDQLIAGL